MIWKLSLTKFPSYFGSNYATCQTNSNKNQWRDMKRNDYLAQ